MGHCQGKNISVEEKDEDTKPPRRHQSNGLSYTAATPTHHSLPNFWPIPSPSGSSMASTLPPVIVLSPSSSIEGTIVDDACFAVTSPEDKKWVHYSIQAFTCEVCKIDCNGKKTMNTHNMGRKHKANLRKLQEKMAAKPSAQARNANEDLQSKKEKVVHGGAAEEDIMVCDLCDVVCNSKAVYATHVSGKKHLFMVKKLETRV